MLNGLVCGALFRPLPGEVKSKKKTKSKAEKTTKVESRRLLDAERKDDGNNGVAPSSIRVSVSQYEVAHECNGEVLSVRKSERERVRE